jgi:hypothetical protein
MTASKFEDYLHNWDRQLNKKKKKTVLVLDNCPAHPKMNLEKIKLTFLPPNSMLPIQPLDQGIIKTFKTFIDQTWGKELSYL